MDEKYETSYRVRISDAGTDGLIKIRSLMQMLQEIATEHANKIGVGFKELASKHLGWALARIYVRIEKMPRWGERVHISTWASNRDRVSTCREFTADSENGTPLFTARSQWLLFDTLKRRIARLDEIGDWPRMENNFANSKNFEERLLKVSVPENEVECAALNDDIDLNGHVNNTVYAAWAAEAIPAEFAKGKVPAEIAINFMEEVSPRAKVRSLFQSDGNVSYHSIINSASLHECARLNVQWKES